MSYPHNMTTATIAPSRRPRDTLANRVCLLRHEVGLSQKAAAAKCGMTAREWQGIEEGRSPRDERSKVNRMALAFGVDREWLTWGGPLAPDTDAPDPGTAMDQIASGSSD